MNRRGLTLVEVLVTTVVLGLFLSLMAGVVVAYRRAYNQLDVAQPGMRSVANGLEVITRELAGMERLYSPEVKVLKTGYAPMSGEPLAFRYRKPDGTEGICSLSYDASREMVVRREHRLPEKDEELDLSSGPERSLGHARGLWVQLEHKGYVSLVTVRLEAPVDGRLPLQTRIRLRSSAFVEVAR